MATKAIIYRINGEDFLKLMGYRKNHQYSVKFLEKIAGFKLSPLSGWMLKEWGYIRVTRDSEGSYRKD